MVESETFLCGCTSKMDSDSDDGAESPLFKRGAYRNKKQSVNSSAISKSKSDRNNDVNDNKSVISLSASLLNESNSSSNVMYSWIETPSKSLFSLFSTFVETNDSTSSISNSSGSDDTNKDELFIGKYMNSMMFDVCANDLYFHPRFISKARDETRRRLYALRQQALHGPNRDSRSACYVWMLSTDEEHKRWELWNLLGNMSKHNAMKRFLQLVKDVDPQFHNHPLLKPPLWSSRIKTVIQLVEYNAVQLLHTVAFKRKIISFVSTMNVTTKVIVALQCKVRLLLAKRKYFAMQASQYSEEVKELLKLLMYGLRVQKVPYNGGKPSNRLLWIDNIYNLPKARLCIAAVNSVPMSVNQSRAHKGIYLQDIAHVRDDGSSYAFKLSALDHQLQIKIRDSSISIVGSERSIDLLLPDKLFDVTKNRDWFVKMLRALCDMSLTDRELSMRNVYRGERFASLKVSRGIITTSSADAIARTKSLLERGISVEEFDSSANDKVGSILWINYAHDNEIHSARFCLGNKAFPDGVKIVKGVRLPNARGIDASDVSEIRPCKVSLSIDSNDGVAYVDTTISIIGTENTLTFIVKNDKLRNALLKRLQDFHIFLKISCVKVGIDIDNDNQCSEEKEE